MGITQENGAEAEKNGAKYLRDAGYTVVEMNEKGEQYLPIDLLATKSNITYAINVKSTQKDGYGLTQANIKGLTNTCLLANYVPAFLFVKDSDYVLFVYVEVVKNVVSESV